MVKHQQKFVQLNAKEDYHIQQQNLYVISVHPYFQRNLKIDLNYMEKNLKLTSSYQTLAMNDRCP